MTSAQATRTDNKLWGADWQKQRDKWRLDASVYHFNHGAYGAVPLAVRARQQEIITQVDNNPTGFYRRELDDLLEAARLEAAAYCGADASGFGFVRNASEGMSVAIDALQLKAGDELLITNHIYPAVRLAVENKCRQTGCRLVEVKLPFTSDDGVFVSLIAAAITSNTRALVVDEIASPTGRIFPIRDLAKVTAEKEIVLVVDGAHTPGTLPLSVDTLGADMWVGNFHKWVCAPHSAGAIWAAPQWRRVLRPPAVGYRDAMAYPQQFGRLGTDDLTGMLCVPAAIKFLADIGAERIRHYNIDLAAHAVAALGAALGTQPVPGHFGARQPANLPTGVATDTAAALELQTRIANELRAEVSIAAPMSGENHGAILVSAFLYNHPSEYEEFAVALKQLLSKH